VYVEYYVLCVCCVVCERERESRGERESEGESERESLDVHEHLQFAKALV